MEARGSPWVHLSTRSPWTERNRTIIHGSAPALGLFAEGRPADFDLFVCRDAFSAIPAVACSNFYGVEKTGTAADQVVTNSSSYGGWFMISGMDFAAAGRRPSLVKIEASSVSGGTLEVWLDDLNSGTRIGTIAVPATGNAGKWITCETNVGAVAGNHDVYIRFLPGSRHAVAVRNIQFADAVAQPRVTQMPVGYDSLRAGISHGRIDTISYPSKTVGTVRRGAGLYATRLFEA